MNGKRRPAATICKPRGFRTEVPRFLFTISFESTVFGYVKLKTKFQCVIPTWEQPKNMSDIIRNMSDIF